jgi:tetratricopeptide (TPR) repeat protein
VTRSRPDAFARATALAFAGRLDHAVAAIDRLPATAGLREQSRWLRAYILAARGDFAQAERGVRGVLVGRADPALRARAAVTLGSILRQTGRHRDARAVESAALRDAPTATDRAHLSIGLAADAVGLGDLAAVDRWLKEAAAWRSRDPRVAVRMRWVRCERELLAADPAAALRHARAALAIARRIRARRHVAKSHLFAGAAALGVARAGSGAASARAEAEARRSLRSARAIAERIDARPIAGVARDLLAASLEGGR